MPIAGDGKTDAPRDLSWPYIRPYIQKTTIYISIWRSQFKSIYGNFCTDGLIYGHGKLGGADYFPSAVALVYKSHAYTYNVCVSQLQRANWFVSTQILQMSLWWVHLIDSALLF